MTQANPMTVESAEAALARLTAHDRGVLTDLVCRVDKAASGTTAARSRKAPVLDEVVRFLVDRQLLLTHFNWGAWEEGQQAIQRRDRATLATCTAQQCLQYLTLLVRADRFTEGTLASAFESGLMQALLHRLHQHTYPHAGR
ncbi:hypothetical protein B7C42_06763 [Nocardia cerradoensis]|uniref:Uncharacterized protein n=1 Tax=Nocardia cerradoensis TaxID=85688 RepID=A0A231GX28_9NOCA|nr:DUF6508 domain-containing protein [Nocardia cerradoensis]OXR41167.1 hypothetical protein B7C42_06763 [Nocardia cerradoensis]